MNSPDPSHLEFFRCPVTHSGLALLTEDQLSELNRAVRDGELKDRGGNAVTQELTSGLANLDKSLAYSIRNGIIQLIADEAILLNQTI